jgi:DUF4097 and DUF4098 domain-containing protein YvlB
VKAGRGEKLKKIVQLIVALALLASMAAAQESRTVNQNGNWVREVNGTLAAAKNLRVSVDAGSVNVEGGNGTDVKYAFRSHDSRSEEKARRDFDSYHLNTYVRGDTAYITAEWQGGRSHRFSGEFSIQVPRDMELVKVETQGGSVTATHLGGRVEVQSGGGLIRIDDVKGAVRAETGGDNVDISSVGGDLNLQTGGGKITLRDIKGNLNASTGGGDVLLISSQQGAILETGGGNIQVQQCGGKLKVSTGGGNIDIGDVAGPVDVETGGGSIRLASAKGPVHAETGAGRIELNGVPAARVETGAGGIMVRFVASPDGDNSSLETAAGDVTVYLDTALHANVRAAIEMANGHKISSDFSEIAVTTEGGEWGPQTVSAQGALNGGGPTIKITTASGNVQIRRAGH